MAKGVEVLFLSDAKVKQFVTKADGLDLIATIQIEASVSGEHLTLLGRLMSQATVVEIRPLQMSFLDREPPSGTQLPLNSVAAINDAEAEALAVDEATVDESEPEIADSSAEEEIAPLDDYSESPDHDIADAERPDLDEWESESRRATDDPAEYSDGGEQALAPLPVEAETQRTRKRRATATV